MAFFNIFSRGGGKAELPTVTDIHCHILPGVDDGAPDLATALEITERMEQMGFKRIFASPHITESTFENTPAMLDAALGRLSKALSDKGSGLMLSRSSENRIDDFFREQLEAGKIRPLPGNYIIVENSFIQEPWNLDQFLFDLKIKGFKPIMAHPERFFYYHDKGMRRYEALHNAGNHFQVNLLSLAGAYGKVEKKVAEALVEKGWVRFLGTDIHNLDHVEAIESYLSTRDARRQFERLAPNLLNDTLESPQQGN